MSFVFDSLSTDSDAASGYPTLRVEIDITNKPTTATRVWTDITAFVRSCSYTLAGRLAETENTQPGALSSLVLDNNAGSRQAVAAGITGRPFDRDNTAGAFYPGLSWAFWIRISAIFQDSPYVRSTVIKRSIPKTRPHTGKDNVATVTGLDAMEVLQLFGLGGQSFSAQASGSRVADVLTAASVPPGTLDAGYSRLTYPAVTFDDNDTTSALSHLAQVEQDERGLLFARADGLIDFQSRYYRAGLVETGPIATIGSTAGTIRYVEGDLDDNSEYRFNSVTVTPTGGTAETSKDQTSIDESFELRKDMQMLSTSQRQARANAQWYKHRYANPAQRIGPLEIRGAAGPALWPVILSAQNSDLFTYAGPDGDILVHLERVSESWEIGKPPTVTWDLSPASRELLWRIGVAGQSEIGETTRLA